MKVKISDHCNLKPTEMHQQGLLLLLSIDHEFTSELQLKGSHRLKHYIDLGASVLKGLSLSEAEVGSWFMVFADLSYRSFRTFSTVFCLKFDLALFAFSNFLFLLLVQILKI